MFIFFSTDTEKSLKWQSDTIFEQITFWMQGRAYREIYNTQHVCFAVHYLHRRWWNRRLNCRTPSLSCPLSLRRSHLRRWKTTVGLQPMNWWQVDLSKHMNYGTWMSHTRRNGSLSLSWDFKSAGTQSFMGRLLTAADSGEYKLSFFECGDMNGILLSDNHQITAF